MVYLWIKAFHIAAAISFIGGLLILSHTLSLLTTEASSTFFQSRLIETVRWWDRWITSPSLGLTWILGITMAIQGDWFTSPWFIVKLLIVIALSALHGLLSGALKRLADTPDHKPKTYFKYSRAGTLSAVLAIAILAVTKPF